MGLKHESGAKTRLQAQRETLGAVGPILAELSEYLDVKLYAYDADLHPLKLEHGKIEFPEQPAGRLTDLGTPLIFDYTEVAAYKIFMARQETSDPLPYALSFWLLVASDLFFWVSRRVWDSGRIATFARGARRSDETTSERQSRSYVEGRLPHESNH